MSWVLLTMLAVNLWVVANIVDKHVISKYIKNPMNAISIQSVLILAYTSIIALFSRISVPSLFYLSVSIFSGILIFFAIVIYYTALKSEEVSRVIPLYSVEPIFVLIMATFFLGEKFTFDKYIGIALLVLGAFLISYRHYKRKQKVSKVVFMMLGASLLYAISFVITKYLTASMDTLSIFVFTEIGLGVSALVFFILNWKEIRKIYVKNKKAVFLISIPTTFGFFGLLVYFMAISQGPASLVNALGNTLGFFVLFYATLVSIFRPSILKEEIRGSVVALKFVAIALIFAGAYLVVV